MSPPLPQQFRELSGELKALALGHWELLRQEMSGKVSLTRRQTILMVAGILTALTAIFLVLAGLTLLLSQLFVSQAGWEPLLAGGVSALIIAVVFALTGWLVFRTSGTRLKAEGFAPSKTIHSLKATVQTLSNQPVIPTQPPIPMNTRQQFQDAVNNTADTVEHQARRAGRAVQDTARAINNKFDPGAFFTQALSWVDAFLTPQNRALAGRALGAAAVLPRRHPGLAALLGLGAAYVYYQKSKGTSAAETIDNYAAQGAAAVGDARRAAANGFQSAAAAGREFKSSLFDSASRVAENGRTAAAQFGNAATATAEAVRETYGHTRESLSEGVERLSETARQLKEDAEAGYRKARDFAKDEPALVIAGGVALAIGAALLVRSSRR